MKRMICTALTALLLVGAPMAVFAQAEGGGAPAAEAAPKAETAPKKQHKKKKAKKHHKKAKSTKGAAKEKPAETGGEMK